MKNIGLLGLGNIGQGVVKLLENNPNYNIKKALVQDKNKKRNIHLNGCKLVNNIYELTEDKDIDIIIEVLGGTSPAYQYVAKALQNKKHVISANKLVIAERGQQLFKIAKKNNAQLHFEAAIGGGIPFVHHLKEYYKSDIIESIHMIINGTSNFILTQMQNGKSYEESLKQAQDLGFAEPDPSFDVNGQDAAQKLAIVASLVLNNWIDWKSIQTKGITNIQQEDIEKAKNNKKKIKLIASFERKPQAIALSVEPKEINIGSNLDVDNELNAIVIKSKNLGELSFVGKGAGQLPTASAIVSDLGRL